MKINFKKISAIAMSTLMAGMSLGVAAAANYPAPFVSGGVANVAVVYGTGTGVSALDQTQAINIQTNLKSGVTSTGSVSAPTGESVTLEKSSDHLNIGNGWNVFTGSIDSAKLPTLLAKGTYVADDSDEYNYEQKINLGNPTLNHTRDSDYESLAGLSDYTPFVGFRIPDSTYILNYTLDFTTDAESDITSGDLEDIEGSTIPLLGKEYYVSDAKNGTSAVTLGTMTLLDTASTTTVNEGETVTVSAGGKDYTISIATLTTTQVKFLVNGETTNELAEGASYNLGGGTYLGVKDIFQRDVTGITGSVEFSIGSGKLEIFGDGSDIELNDDTIRGVKGWIHRGTGSSGSEKIDKIVIQWLADDEVFLTPDYELTIPGFGGLKFTMTELVRPTEEKISVSTDSERIKLIAPIKDGDASFDIVYSERVTGNLTGIGKDSTHRLATTTANALTFYEKDSTGADQDEYFVASYNISSEAESYLLKADIYNGGTSSHPLNYTTITNVVTGETVCKEYTTSSSSCDMGLVSLTISNVNYTSSGTRAVTFTAGTNVNFHTLYTKGGLKIWLPYGVANATANLGVPGAVNFTQYSSGETAAGQDEDSFYLVMNGEDKDDAIAGGTEFNLTINNYGTAGSYDLEVTQVNHNLPSTLRHEVGSGTGNYEKYIVDDVAPRIMHYTKGDPDYAEVYYPTGDSETYAKVYLTSEGASTTSGTSSSGVMVVMDSEISSVSSKNLIIVGGSCINSAAATLLGGSYCGASFTQSTGIGSGQFLIKGYSGAFSSGKLALLVAGYEADDTVNAATYLTNQVVDTSKEYTGTSATEATISVA